MFTNKIVILKKAVKTCQLYVNEIVTKITRKVDYPNKTEINGNVLNQTKH